MTFSRLILLGTGFLLCGCAVSRSDAPLYQFVSENVAEVRQEAPPVNVSEAFEERFLGERMFTEDEVLALGEVRILFVPGLLSDQLRKGHGGYFDRQNAFLLESGIRSEIFSGPSAQETIEHRVDDLAAHVASQDRPVILIGHSKGGLEIVELLLHHPEAAKKVRAWAALQTPFFGSPVADLFVSGPLGGVSGRSALEILGGDAETLDELSTETRTAYYRSHRSEVAAMLTSTPSLLISAWITEDLPANPVGSFFWRARRGRLFSPSAYSILKANRDLILLGESGEPNDGLVPRSSAILPGSRYVAIDGPDHRGMIGDYALSVWSNEERERLIVATLSHLMANQN